jgi:hypothetical protein
MPELFQFGINDSLANPPAALNLLLVNKIPASVFKHMQASS